MKSTPKQTVKEAIWLMEEGLSTRETAQRLKISKTTAAKIRKDNKENMKVHKGGRPRKLGADTVEYLKTDMKRGLIRSGVEAQKEANKLVGQPVSVTTVRRRLREAGLIAKRIVKRP
ncbi:hypothetical protein BGZ80_007622, partial [Entomortierella chlamydospora]